MKINYLLILSICLLGFCISQQTKQKNKLDFDEYDQYKLIITYEQPDEEVEDGEKEDVENLIKLNENSMQSELDKSTNELISFYSNPENGESGQCFTNMISSCKDSNQLCIENLLDQMKCLTNECQLQVPQASQYKDCILNYCKSHQNIVQQHNSQVYKCLLAIEKQNNTQQSGKTDDDEQNKTKENQDEKKQEIKEEKQNNTQQSGKTDDDDEQNKAKENQDEKQNNTYQSGKTDDDEQNKTKENQDEKKQEIKEEKQENQIEKEGDKTNSNSENDQNEKNNLTNNTDYKSSSCKLQMILLLLVSSILLI
ncbi:hypothetical protein TTHERM_00643520 (macronuclear) [Tetrahymena thermophila SB210]|uniref:Transmembrane protein n=1 Tax=Tetrahymena thermophila (strain SB210) TaxID=312017 RepID=Q23EX9_TETTS|nr:hypothetical protein TTHERM_00643520 [Tetrahymena thermophila SB210]EAR95126.1 hypothetical protein TTHERM_00643520 [Tetrahymena thermophila SB210]|eukprot:XP_001015371.1 hypothetical protein TTHERM_00643520 [Tetrahymena thermophila SB210]